jgi:hypothetical protein
MIRRKTKRAGNSIIAKAREYATAGRKAEAIDLIDRASPDFKGLPDAESLDAYRRSITPR